MRFRGPTPYLVACALALACGPSEQASAPAAAEVAAPEAAAPETAAPEAAAATPAPAAPEAAAPAPAATPVSAPPLGDAAQGQQLYVQFCGSCHGNAGKGDGPVAVGLDPKPRDHTDGTYMNTLDHQRLYQVIRDGGMGVGLSPLMAPWGGVLSDEQIGHVMAFVRSLAIPPYVAEGSPETSPGN